MLATISTTVTVKAPVTVSPERQAVRDLGKSLRAGDLDAAREAYVDIIRNAPEGATWQKDSGFAQIGKALVQGDLEGAKTAFADTIKGKIGLPAGQDPGTPPSEPPVPVPSSTGGASGSLLNVVA